ncbi:MAG: hypothetical protein JWP97_3847 [Labilithrix sp.]|nr:hypothetical protein [Labilithrix sp.]
MNQALFPSSFTLRVAVPVGPARVADAPRTRPIAPRQRPSRTCRWTQHEEMARLRHLRSLLSLFALYASSLLIVVLVSEGADIGCILGGIAGHVLFAAHRIFRTWRDAALLEDAKARLTARPRLV